jgi:N-acetylneuraminic acid mutarotase
MKPSIALVALLISACGGSPNKSGNTPTGPTPVEPGEWGLRAALIAPNSELALAELNGKLYLLGGYPASRQTVSTVQIYDIASDHWELGPPLPRPNNHGMAASVNGKIYLIGGQTTADDPSYVNTVYELDPTTGRRRRCPRRAAPG